MNPDSSVSSLYIDGGYRHKNPSWHIEDSRWKSRHILAALSLLPKSPCTICEIGCGAWEILRQMELHFSSERSVELVGYDISPQAFALARARESQQRTFVLGDARNDERHFDLLLGIDVIEHIENHFEFLRGIRLKADYFIFHIPIELNCESLLRDFLMDSRRLYGHIHEFTKDTALATLQECGYTVMHLYFRV